MSNPLSAKDALAQVLTLDQRNHPDWRLSVAARIELGRLLAGKKEPGR